MKPCLRILYIGQLWEGASSLERMRLLERMGHQVIPMDTTRWVAGGARLIRSLAHRLNAGPAVRGLNRAVVACAGTIGPMDLVWVDKGRWIYPDTLVQLKEKTRARLVHYTPDPQLVHHKSRYFLAGIPLYDMVVTTKRFELSLYRKAGARKVLEVMQGYDARFSPIRPSPKDCEVLGSDVCFIGHCERHYAHYLRVAAHVSPNLRVWGPGWPWYARFHPWAKRSVAGDGVWGERYRLALASSKIALGLLSHRIPETTTTRSFEIPATGVFLLAERTEDHLELFQEGIEAEFFGSTKELQDKITFYLKHERARAKIAEAGRLRCVASRYQSESQLAKVIEELV